MLLKHCRLIPELSEHCELTEGDIRITDGKIEAILPAIEVYDGEEVIDAAGRTVMPGLFDLHAHLCMESDDFSCSYASESQTIINCISYAKDLLHYGFTTVRDCGDFAHGALTVRNAIRAGIVDGPDVIGCGLIITPTAKGNDTFASMYYEVDDPAGLMGACRKEMAAGADFIKYMSTGSVANAGGEPGQLVTTREELEAVVRAADSLDTYVGSHCHGAEGIRLCIETGVRTIEHATYIDDDCIESILSGNRDTRLVATFACMYDPYLMYFDMENPPEIIRQCYEAFEAAKIGIRKAYDAGIPVGWGSDNSHRSFLRKPASEFIARQHMGLSNLQLLRQATMDSAKIIDQFDRKGSVDIGKQADLLIVNGNPDEDLMVMNRKPDCVLKAGVVY